MYVTLTDLRKGELPWCLKNKDGRLKIALCEITYSPNWQNIGEDLGNNILSINFVTKIIPDGYYNVCELNEKIFEPIDAELVVHSPSGFLKLRDHKGSNLIQLRPGLAKTLGFNIVSTVLPGKEIMGTERPKLIIHKLNVHLRQLSNFQNIYNGMPSTVLRDVSVENVKCGGSQTVVFPELQYKALITGDIPHLEVFVLDEHGKEINLDYISVTLHVKRG